MHITVASGAGAGFHGLFDGDHLTIRTNSAQLFFFVLVFIISFYRAALNAGRSREVSVRPSVSLSVCLSVYPSVRQTGEL